MKKLTVVQMLPALESGGVERGTLEVGKYLVEHGHRSIVISAGGRLVTQLEREGSEHLVWDVGRKSLLTPLRYVRRLRRLLQDEKVDILHIRSRMPGWVGYLAWKGMDPAHRPRFVTTVHGLYSVNAYSAVMVKGERVIAVSETVRDYINRNFPGVDAARITVINRGVSTQAFPHGYQPSEEWLAAWRNQFPQLAGKKVVTLPGRITRLKGHEDFIQLIGRLIADAQPVHGLIVGGAHPRKQRYLIELKQLITKAGLENAITLTGQRDDLREIMAVSNLVLSLSTQPESFGRTTLEALSLGIPVAGYNHGGVGELLEALYPNGLVPLGNLDALEKTVNSLLSQAHLPLPNDLFSLEQMLERTLRLYLESAPYGMGSQHV